LEVPLVEFDVTSMFSIPFIGFGILFVRVTGSDLILVVWVSFGAVSCVFGGIYVAFLFELLLVLFQRNLSLLLMGFFSAVLTDFGLFHSSLKKFHTVGNSFNNAY